MTIPSHPLPQRRRALAELDAVIERAERTRARCQLDLGDAVARAQPPGRANAMLKLAEERLEQLRRSRQVLLAGTASEA